MAMTDNETPKIKVRRTTQDSLRGTNEVSGGNTPRNREAGDEPVEGPPVLVGSPLNDPYAPPGDTANGGFVERLEPTHHVRLTDVGNQGKIMTPSDNLYVNPASYYKVAEEGALGGPGLASLESLIQARVDEALRATQRVASPMVNAVGTNAAVEPAKFLKHYRNMADPNTIITERDMSSGVPGDEVRGGEIRFRRGHFFATTENQVKQIEWMMSNPAVDPTDPSRIIGGNPNIYEDDGLETVTVSDGQVFVKGSAAHKAYLRNVRGIEV